MVHGLKRIETRSDYFAKKIPTGLLLIHAAKQWGADHYDLCGSGPFREALELIGCKLPVPQPGDKHPRPTGMPFGAIVGCVNVRGIISTDRVKWEPNSARYFAFDQFSGQLVISSAEKAFGDYSDGRIAVVTDQPKVFRKPIGYVGRQGLFDVPEQVYAVGQHHLG